MECAQLPDCPHPKRVWLWTEDLALNAILVLRPTCKLWSCPYCSIRNSRRWAARVKYGVDVFCLRGETFRFVTLTMHEKLLTFDACVKVWPKVWNKLQGRMRRADKRPLHYALVPERHKDGRLHFHMVTSGDMTQRWYKDNLRSSGGGYQADCKPIDSSTLAAWYCSKYMSKTIKDKAWPEHFRRIRTSTNWPELPDLGDADGLDYAYNVCKTEQEIYEVIMLHRMNGWRIVNKTSGELV